MSVPRPGIPAGVPTLDDVAQNPSLAADLSLEVARALLAQCALVQGVLLARVLTGAGNGQGAPTPAEREEEVRVLTAPQVAELLAVPRSYVYDLIRRGILPAVRLPALDPRKAGRYVRVLLADLHAWLDQHPHETRGPGSARAGLTSPVYQRYSKGRGRSRASTTSAPPSAHPGRTRRAARGDRDHRGAVGARRAGDLGTRGASGAAPGDERAPGDDTE